MFSVILFTLGSLCNYYPWCIGPDCTPQTRPPSRCHQPTTPHHHPLPTATKAHMVGKQAVRILLECFLVLISFCSELLQTMTNQENVLLRLSAWRSLTPETIAYCLEQICPQTKPRKIFFKRNYNCFRLQAAQQVSINSIAKSDSCPCCPDRRNR